MSNLSVVVNSPANHFADYLHGMAKSHQIASQKAIRFMGNGLKQDLRQEIVAAGLGQRLANTWRMNFFENHGYDPATQVFSKAPLIVKGFQQASVIHNRNGGWLAIPTPAASRAARRFAGQRVTPKSWEQNIGPLRLIKPAGKPPMLVADNLRARTGKRNTLVQASNRALKTGNGLSGAVIFILVPMVRQKKRLSSLAIMRKWQERAAQIFRDNWIVPNAKAA